MEKPTIQEEYFAAWLHRSFANVRNWHLGASPGWRIEQHAEKVAHLLSYGLDEINKSIVQTDDQNIWMAPSPWHAALYCHMLQHHMMLNGSRLLFRGHRNSSWKLTPSILREGVDVDREIRRADILSRLLAEISFNTMVSFHPYSRTNIYCRIGPSSYIAAAQHYGIKTHLLDFTTDPDVAVKFATAGGDSDDETASVIAVPIETAEANGLSIILPPPFIERLYIQRGVFVESHETLEKQRISAIEIRFPFKPSQKEIKLPDFEVLRDGSKPVDLTPPHTGLNTAIELVDKIIRDDVPVNDVHEIHRIARDLKSNMEEVVRNPQTMWHRFVDHFEDTLYALVYNIDEKETLSIDMTRLAAIVKSNPEVCCSISSIYKSIDGRFTGIYPPEKILFMLKIATLIDVIAGNVGYNHQQAAAEHANAMGLPTTNWT